MVYLVVLLLWHSKRTSLFHQWVLLQCPIQIVRVFGIAYFGRIRLHCFQILHQSQCGCLVRHVLLCFLVSLLTMHFWHATSRWEEMKFFFFEQISVVDIYHFIKIHPCHQEGCWQQ